MHVHVHILYAYMYMYSTRALYVYCTREWTCVHVYSVKCNVYALCTGTREEMETLMNDHLEGKLSLFDSAQSSDHCSERNYHRQSPSTSPPPLPPPSSMATTPLPPSTREATHLSPTPGSTKRTASPHPPTTDVPKRKTNGTNCCGAWV